MTDKQRLEEIKERCYEGRPICRIDVKFLIEQLETAWLEIERMRNEVSVPNGDFSERKRSGSTYENVRKELESWPDWKKKAYNDNFLSAHAKPLEIKQGDRIRNTVGKGE
jgi:hypothetical protein